MKSFLLFTGSGPLVVLSSHENVQDTPFLEKLAAKGIYKFIAHELPLETVKERYGSQYDVATRDIYETDDLRVVDFDGQRIFRRFKFTEYGVGYMHEPDVDVDQIN